MTKTTKKFTLAKPPTTPPASSDPQHEPCDGCAAPEGFAANPDGTVTITLGRCALGQIAHSLEVDRTETLRTADSHGDEVCHDCVDEALANASYLAELIKVFARAKAAATKAAMAPAQN